MVGSADSEKASDLKGQRAVMLETLLRKLPMVKLRASAMAAMALAAAAGCTGFINGEGDDDNTDAPTPEELAAIDAWEKDGGAYDKFMETCVACHRDDPNYPYLAGADKPAVRRTILDFSPNPVINLESPSSSRVLVKPAHYGADGLNATQAAAVLEWIEKEKIAAGVEDGGAEFQIEPFEVVDGLNTIPLDDLGFPGASISFVNQSLTTMLYVTELQLNGGDEGVHMVHPFFTWHVEGEDTVGDSLDRFFNVDLDVDAGLSAQISGGATGFSGFSDPAGKLSMTFTVLEEYQGGGIVEPDGCAALPEFEANVVPRLEASCTGCHGGGVQGATSALDMTDVGGDNAAACVQFSLRTNFESPDISGVFVAPDPSSGGGHDFKFGGNQANWQAYKDDVLIWIAAEVAQ